MGVSIASAISENRNCGVWGIARAVCVRARSASWRSSSVRRDG